MARLGDAKSTCEECSACSLLWCSVSELCFCGGDNSCDGELLAGLHVEQIERNREIAEWCPDAWSSCASTEVGCQEQYRTDDCSLCRNKDACSWCLYKDAVGASAAMCIFNGAAGGQVQPNLCEDIRTECPVVVIARTENLDAVFVVIVFLAVCGLGSVFGAIFKAKLRRKARRATRDAARLRAQGSGQDAHGANSMMEARKVELKVALSLLPSFEFGKLAPPPSGTPLDELPTFEQRQLDLSTGGRMTGGVDDRIIDRPGSKAGPAKSLRAKSLAAKEAPGLEELVLCSICISGYHDDNTCSMLPCGHIFHRKCIDQWLQSGRTASGDCPMCKEPIMQGAMQEEVDEALGKHITAPRPSGRARVDPSRREIV